MNTLGSFTFPAAVLPAWARHGPHGCVSGAWHLFPTRSASLSRLFGSSQVKVALSGGDSRPRSAHKQLSLALPACSPVRIPSQRDAPWTRRKSSRGEIYSVQLFPNRGHSSLSPSSPSPEEVCSSSFMKSREFWRMCGRS